MLNLFIFSILLVHYVVFFVLPLQVIDKSMPVFNKQFYSDTVAENIELHSPLSVSIEAESRKYLNKKNLLLNLLTSSG